LKASLVRCERVNLIPIRRANPVGSNFSDAAIFFKHRTQLLEISSMIIELFNKCGVAGWDTASVHPERSETKRHNAQSD
jgi:hypothetical protein